MRAIRRSSCTDGGNNACGQIRQLWSESAIVWYTILKVIRGQICSNLQQMPPDSSGIFMGVDQSCPRVLPQGWQPSALGIRCDFDARHSEEQLHLRRKQRLRGGIDPSTLGRNSDPI